jgi:outer membrane protein
MKIINSLALCAAVTFAATACGSKTKKEENTKADVPVVRTDGLKIAYYNQDTLATKFTYYTEMDSLVKSKQLKFQAELGRKEKALRDFLTTNDAKAKSGELSAFEIQSIQQEAQRREQALYAYQETEGTKIQQETSELLEVIGKKIEVAGKKYCKENNIDVLLIQAKGGQINYINEAMDVTKEFTAYLNQHQSDIESDMGKSVKKDEQKDKK